MPMHIDIVHRLCGGQLVDLNRVNAGPDHNRRVPANGAQQFNWSGFSLMLGAAQIMVLAWQVIHVPWPLLLLALMTWFIGCLRLYGFQIAFPVYYHWHGDNNNQGAAAPASAGAGRDGMVNNAVEENTIPDGGSLAWSGYAMIVLSVLALWSGFVSEPVAVFLAFVLLLLGCGFLHVAMLAPSKPKML
uniref:Uncharacterized protein n=1 Tax=Oryza meridionalis TaxID=40149 RepID=A0A0E0E587_9ORYZ